MICRATASGDKPSVITEKSHESLYLFSRPFRILSSDPFGSGVLRSGRFLFWQTLSHKTGRDASRKITFPVLRICSTFSSRRTIPPPVETTCLSFRENSLSTRVSTSRKYGSPSEEKIAVIGRPSFFQFPNQDLQNHSSSERPTPFR